MKNLVRLAMLSCAALYLLNCNSETQLADEKSSWCDQLLREQFSQFPEINVLGDWFKVYEVGEKVYAIAEPFNFQEVISYLILGNEKALLFDSGMGLDSMSVLVDQLTDLPIVVINSHSHYDHIGSNHEFEHILALDTAYMHQWAKKGWNHEMVKHEVSPEAFCLEKLPYMDTANYRIEPFTITEFIKDGHRIELGERELQVISVPGHTPDAIALYEEESGYLWTGDTFYEAPIWLFFEGTDLKAYEKSIQRLAGLHPKLNRVFPAHNTPVAEPNRMLELVDAFGQIIKGTKQAKGENIGDHPEDQDALLFEFEHFSFMIRREFLEK